MKPEEMIIDSKFNFNDDISVIRTRIHSITQEFMKDLKCFSSYIDVKNIFQIVSESKSLSDYLKKNSPTYIAAVNRTALGFKGISLGDLIRFEKKMLIVSFFIIFETFYKNIILLGAFYNTEGVNQFFKKSKSIDKVIKAIKDKNVRDFEKLILERLNFSVQAKQIKEIFKCIYGVEFFPDKKTESIILDFVKIRNIIVHQNSNPKEKDYKDIEFNGIIRRNSSNENINVIYKYSKKEKPIFKKDIITFSIYLENNDFFNAVLVGLENFTRNIFNKVLSKFNKE